MQSIPLVTIEAPKAGQVLYLELVEDGVDPALLMPTDPVLNKLADPEFMRALVFREFGGVKLERHRLSRFDVFGALKMMGCKPMHALAVANQLFDGLSSQILTEEEAVTLTTTDFLRIMQWHLLQYVRANLKDEGFGYSRKSTILDFTIACDVKAGRHPLIILLGGTSGCGKSTLASLLASRLGITTVLSTDNVRHIMRNYVDAKENPVLFASTYNAGEALTGADHMSVQERILAGYKTQSKMVQSQLVKLLDAHVERHQTIIVEGVHLTVDFLVEMMQRHRCVLPFLVYISNDNKHRERFAVRARYMTLSPHVNKYVKHFENIRIIQGYLSTQAQQMLVPRIDNTNIDRSLASLHATLINTLRKCIVPNVPLFDKEAGKATALNDIYERTQAKTLWRSKEMLEKIQEKKIHKRRWSWPTPYTPDIKPSRATDELGVPEPDDPALTPPATSRSQREGLSVTFDFQRERQKAQSNLDLSLHSADATVTDTNHGLPDEDGSGSEISVDEFEKFAIDEFCAS